jgi:hypothetical protein
MQGSILDYHLEQAMRMTVYVTNGAKLAIVSKVYYTKTHPNM